MKKDYSEYKHTDYEKYNIPRQSNSYVYYDFFINFASFDPDSKLFSIKVDRVNEDLSMKDAIDEFEEFERSLREVRPDILSNEDIADYEQSRVEGLEKNKALREHFSAKYNIDWDESDKYFQDLMDEYEIKKEEPLHNVLSGAVIDLQIGEGILDFIYADFKTPFNESYGFVSAFDNFIKNSEEKRRFEINEKPEKIYNCNQENVEMFFRYTDSKLFIENIANASLYSAICPPVFLKENLPVEGLKWYYNYLVTLQNEYKELIEFCFDEDFYPEVMEKIKPAERYYLYKIIHNQPLTIQREEYFSYSRSNPNGKILPIHLSHEDFLSRFMNEYEPTEKHKEFQKKYSLSDAEMEVFCRFPISPNTSYKFRNIRKALELEFTKMLEQDIRLRKCKRCGKYFIMKGNYNTNYCDRIAEGETRNCQDIIAFENYKKKTADNAAIKIYNKYYKRYSARVKAHTILEKDFKKWKYEAMTKRNECMDGKLTEEDFINWMNSSSLIGTESIKIQTRNTNFSAVSIFVYSDADFEFVTCKNRRPPYRDLLFDVVFSGH